MSERVLGEEEILALERPERSLLTYYLIARLAWGPAAPVGWLISYFRYHTLRYRFTREGISMSWGVLFRREIHLTYARIQDIHLSSNLVERWLGLARIDIQTASGTAKAEMTIEGIAAFQSLRDFLYDKMRGARERGRGESSGPDAGSPRISPDAELASVLLDIAAELRALRREVSADSSGEGGRDV